MISLILTTLCAPIWIGLMLVKAARSIRRTRRSHVTVRLNRGRS